MSRPQILCPQRSFGQTQDSRHQFPLLQPGGQYTPHSFGPHSHPLPPPQQQQHLHSFANAQLMAQQATMVRRMLKTEYRDLTCVKQQQHSSEGLEQRPSWTQQLLPSGLKSSLDMTDQTVQAYATGVDQHWRSVSGRDQSSAWDDAQIVLPDSNRQFLCNGDLMYSPDAAQHLVAQPHSSYGGQLRWTASAMRGGIAATGPNASDFDSINTLSPQSYLSDGADISFSPCSVPDQASLLGDWSVTSSVPIKEPSPQYPSSFSHPSLALAHNNSFRQCPDTVGLAGDELSIATSSSSTRAGHLARRLVTSLTDEHQSSSEGSLAAVDGSKSLWYMSAYSTPRSDVRLMYENARAHKAQSGSNVNAASTSIASFSSYPSLSGTGSQDVRHVQSNYQDRFQAPRSPDVQTQRQRNDELLLQGKQDGLTYREIRKKMLGEKPAESTLRGRYRSLTKARKDRVRKPVWHRRDVSILILSFEKSPTD